MLVEELPLEAVPVSQGTFKREHEWLVWVLALLKLELGEVDRGERSIEVKRQCFLITYLAVAEARELLCVPDEKLHLEAKLVEPHDTRSAGHFLAGGEQRVG